MTNHMRITKHSQKITVNLQRTKMSKFCKKMERELKTWIGCGLVGGTPAPDVQRLRPVPALCSLRPCPTGMSTHSSIQNEHIKKIFRRKRETCSLQPWMSTQQY